MSNDADEFWSWLHASLQNLKHSLTVSPELTWIERREQFLAELGLTDPEQHPVVQLLVLRLDELPDQDRNSVLSTDEIDRQAYEIIQQTSRNDIADGYDEAAWNAYLTANLAQWDRSAESWDSFMEWFIYYAAEAGLGVPALEFVQYVNGMAQDDRVATFAQYGEYPAEGSAPDPQDAPLPSRDAVVAEIAKEVPGFEQLSEQEIAQIISEVMQESGR